MSNVYIPTRFQLRKDTAANWAANNPTPLDGEPCLETDTGIEKVGDGVTPYNDLLCSRAGLIDLAGLADGDALVWDAAAGKFKPGTAGGGSSSRYVNPAFSSVSSLLHFNGTHGSTTITDQVAGNTWTAQNATISTAQAVFDGAAVKFAGAGNSCVWMPTNSKFNVGAGDWALEFRIYPSGSHQTSARIFQTRDGDIFGAISLLLTSTNIMQLFMSSTGTSFDILNGATIGALGNSSSNRVILQRVGNAIQCFTNGNASYNAAVPASTSLYYNAADTVIIGGNKTGISRSINAYVDEFRFTKGVGVVAPDIPPLTTPFPDS